MKRKNWVYTEAPGCKVGLMKCRDCGVHIKTGIYRYYETEHAYVPQCEKCASSDQDWQFHMSLISESKKKNHEDMVNTELPILIERIKDAFLEGWHSYSTPACAYNSPEEAWEESESKIIYDALKLIGETK
ncbi:MAG: hypothetical protein [Caudoviricetes sp.]|nr:MAG: hypothetical protein [Caudoviricetes sp.]